MKSTIKSIAKITGKSAFKWLVIFVPALFFSVFCFVTAIFLLSNNTGGGFSGAGHAGWLGAVLGVFILFGKDFWVMLLATLSLLAFPAIYFTVANKLAIQSAISSIWENKLQGWFSDKVATYSDKITNDHSSKLSKINDYASVKMQLVNSVKQDGTTNKWQKRILKFILKKIHLDDIDFSDKDLKLSNVIAVKMNQVLSELAKPSNKLFYIVFGVHVLLLILAFVFDQK